jgi:hypothetical protein
VTAIRHKPWVGDKFATSMPRLMILGDSHHNGGLDPKTDSSTIRTVDDWILGVSKPSYRFFTNLAIAVTGDEPSRLNRRESFQQILFYNYVLAIMSGSRESPTKENYAESELAFREVVEKHRPTHIAVLGHKLWNNMPYFDPPGFREGESVTLEDRRFNIGRWRTANAEPLAMWMQHPSSVGFNGRAWYPRLQAFRALP